MDISINASVDCTDGHFGQVAKIIINPITQQLTHIVIKPSQNPQQEHVVSRDQILAARPESVSMNCTCADLNQSPAFRETAFINPKQSSGSPIPYWTHPYVKTQSLLVPLTRERIPPGEFAFSRGTRVEATDGFVGHIGEFVVDPVDGHITHVMLRDNHRWEQKEVVIPVSEIDRYHDGGVVLKINQQAVSQLPTVPIHRNYNWQPEPSETGTQPAQSSEVTQSSNTLETYIPDLASQDRLIQNQARTALVQIGRPAVDPLLALLKSGNYHLRWQAARVLGQINDPTAIPGLMNALEDEELEVRWRAAEELTKFGATGLKAILEALIDRSHSARFREGVHHILRVLASGAFNVVVLPVLESLEGPYPDLKTPYAAYNASRALEASET